MFHLSLRSIFLAGMGISTSWRLDANKRCDSHCNTVDTLRCILARRKSEARKTHNPLYDFESASPEELFQKLDVDHSGCLGKVVDCEPNRMVHFLKLGHETQRSKDKL